MENPTKMDDLGVPPIVGNTHEVEFHDISSDGEDQDAYQSQISAFVDAFDLPCRNKGQQKNPWV